MKRLRTIMTIVSAAICLSLLIIFPFSYPPRNEARVWIDDSGVYDLVGRFSISLTRHFHLRFSDGGIWFYRNELPYRGSIRSFGDGQGGVYYEGGRVAHGIRDWVWRAPFSSGDDYGFLRTTYIGEQQEFVGRDIDCDLPGIYFRHFDWWKEERRDWTLMISLWYPILFSAIFPLLWGFRRIRPGVKIPVSQVKKRGLVLEV